MIDIENEVYTRLKTAIGNTAKTASTYTPFPQEFPFVSITMSDNYMSHLDNSDTEKYSTCMFEVNVYANDSRAKLTAKGIMQTIDTEMYSMNMTRLSYLPTPNMEDATIYRLTARYECETDGTRIYRR